MIRRHATPPGQYTINFDSDDIEEPDIKPVAEQAKAPALSYDEIQKRAFHYISFGSGSSGNSCYIGNCDAGLIIDAGVKPEFVEQTLAKHGVKMTNVRGVLLTHDHSDHTRFVYSMLRAFRHLRLFCTNRVMQGLLKRHNLSKRIKDYHIPIYKEIPFKLAEFEITAFDVPHDGTDNMGFFLTYKGRNFAVATDLGTITERADYYMSRANYLMIESNYDLRMLVNGSYPEHLKARIQLDNGHLDNTATAAFLRRIAGPQLRFVFLCHLSQDNNTPEIALEANRRALQEAGFSVGGGDNTVADRQADIRLMALPRFEATRRFILRP